MPIHPTAIIHPTARIHESASIGPNADIGEEAEIGEGCVIANGAILAPRVVMGKFNTVGPYAMIGGDPQFLGFDSSMHSGVRMGDNNVFREYATVHRSIYPDGQTVLGDSNYFMVCSHVGHDCIVGNNVVMVNYSGVSGHVTIEDRVFISGHVGVQQFCRIGRVAMIGGATGVNRDVPPYTTAKGNFGFIAGLNIVGMRRAGIGSAARLALRQAYKTIFRTGLSLPRGIAAVRAEWERRDDTPPELLTFLQFLEGPSKRGFLTARSHDKNRDDRSPADDE